MEGYYYVYIATNCRHSVLYTGVTRNIFKRAWQHKDRVCKNSFTARYNVCKIVFYESFMSPIEAIVREKQIKGGSRKKKIILIESINPAWQDLVEKSLE